MASTQPLSGLRVLDCTGWFGALAGRLLADAGADVLQVVAPAGDPFEGEPPFFGDSATSIQDAWYNAGKRVAALDLQLTEGRTAFLELVAGADILIEEWGPIGAVSAAALAAQNPRLARVSVSPMGLTGPLVGWDVTDLVANALSGGASVTGDAESGPINGYGNQAANTVGLYAAVCALAARRAAEQTGESQHVDLSSHEALVSCTEQVLMEWFFPEGAWQTQIAPRQGSLHWSNAYAVYPSRDGHGVMVTAALRFADVLLPWLIEEGAAQDLADATKFPNILSMLGQLPYIMEVIREWIATRDAEYIFFEGQRRHQPMGIVWNIAEAMQSPQIEAREYLSVQPITGFGPAKFPGRFFRTSADGPPPGPPSGLAGGDIEWQPRPTPTRSTGPGTASAPLAGVRVLDFTHVLAGPFGTRILGDLGADVIKVGTAIRGGGANTPEHPYYMCWNRNKRSVSINMACDAGREFARKLAGECDVIIENFSAGVLKRWGLDRESLAKVNPGVSVVSMGGMGQTGPWKDFVTFAPTIHALTGLTYLTNPVGQHGLGYGFSLTDHLSGLAGALASLEAIEYRTRTGQGLAVDVSQYELGLSLMGPAIIDYFANGTNPEPVGNRHAFALAAPHGIYPCAGDDAWVAIDARGNEHWAALCKAFGQFAALDDPRFATHGDRITNRDALDALVTNWTSTRDRFEVAEMLQAAGIAAGAVQNARDLAERDPQLSARGFFGALYTDGRGEYGFDKFPALFNGQRPSANEGVHLPGADTFEVASGLLGLSDDDIAALLADGALS